MAFLLSTGEIARLNAAVDTLLSPFDHAELEHWLAAVVRSTEAFFCADRSCFLLPLPERLVVWSEDVPEEALLAIREYITGFEPGVIRMRDPEVDRAFQLRNQAEMLVHSHRSLEKLAGERLRRCRFRHEVMVPFGIDYYVGIRLPLMRGDAQLNWGYSAPRKDPFGEENALLVAALLLPAFRAGIRVALATGSAGPDAFHSLDALGVAAFLMDPFARPVAMTGALAALLAREPQRDELAAAAAHLARDCRRHVQRKSTDVGAVPRTLSHVTTTSARYTLRALHAPMDPGIPHGSTVISVDERSEPEIPSVPTLVARFGLTTREAEVARLLAGGASDRDVSALLGISTHTARKHAEHVFTKLDIHSRKALGLRIMRFDLGTPGIPSSSRLARRRGPCLPAREPWPV